jgi:hypothetical protein
MALISYKEWRTKLQEASPTTRLRNGIMMGNYPMSAGVMSRSTPSPEFVKKAIKELGSPEHPLKKKHKKKKKKGKKHGS